MYLDERRQRHRTNWQERFSLAYLHAIAATAGITCQQMGEDIDGIDVQLGAEGSRGVLRFPKLEAQLKSWTRPVERDRHFRYRLKVRNYEYLRIPNNDLAVPRILVLVVMPRSAADWFHMTHEEGTLRHCAYWASLAGLPPTDNAKEVTIDVPKANQLTVQTIEAIMTRIANRGDP
jgi:Domain of unknown function (DUF4365)